MVKTAFNPISGMGSRTNFERTFAQMASAYIDQNCPILSQYGLGFQLIRMQDDGARAEGILVFKIGEQRVFVPVFFIDGRLNGAEMMLVDGMNLIVPTTDDWVCELLNQRPLSIGKGIKREDYRGSIRGGDLEGLTRSPFKQGSAVNEVDKAIKEMLPKWARIRQGYEMAEKWPLDLTELCKQSNVISRRLRRMGDAYPMFAAALKHYHPDIDLSETKQAADDIEPTVSRYVVDSDSMHDLGGRRSDMTIYFEADKLILDDDTATKVKIRGYAVDDKRDKQPIVVIDEDANQMLCNPSEIGIYDLFIRPGVIVKAAIIPSPHSPRRELSKVVVIILEGEHAGGYLTTNMSHVWTVGGAREGAWCKFVEGLPSSPEGDEDDYGVFVNHKSGTMPVRVDFGTQALPTRRYFVDDSYDSYPAGRAPEWDVPSYTRNLSPPDMCIWEEWRRGIRNIGPSLYVGGDSKWLAVDHGLHDQRILGTPREWESGLLRDMSRVKVAHVVGGYKLTRTTLDENCPVVRSQFASDRMAVPALMLLTGVGEKQAEDLLNRATHGSTTAYVEKSAIVDPSSYGVSFEEPDTSYGDNPLSRQYPAERMATKSMLIEGPDPNGDLARQMSDIADETPDQMMKLIQRAADTGQQEVFDVSVLKSLIESSDERGLFDDFLSPIIRGGDAIARVLIQIWSHRDEADARFGKSDRANIEDMLRSAFEAVGKVAINLKRKTIRPGGIDLTMAND